MSFLINLPGLYGISTMKNNFNLFFSVIYFCYPQINVYACTSFSILYIPSSSHCWKNSLKKRENRRKSDWQKRKGRKGDRKKREAKKWSRFSCSSMMSSWDFDSTLCTAIFIHWILQKDCRVLIAPKVFYEQFVGSFFFVWFIFFSFCQWNLRMQIFFFSFLWRIVNLFWRILNCLRWKSCCGTRRIYFWGDFNRFLNCFWESFEYCDSNVEFLRLILFMTF